MNKIILEALGFVGVVTTSYFFYLFWKKLQTKSVHKVSHIVEVFCTISKEIEEELEKPIYFKLLEKRINNIDNNDKYRSITIPFLSKKYKKTDQIKENVLRRYNMTLDDFLQMTKNINFTECEEYLYQTLYQPKISKELDEEEVKQIFRFHYQNTRKALEEFNFFKNMPNTPNVKLDVMIMRTKIEDLTYREFGITLNQLKYFLYKHNLHNDEEIKQLQASLKSF